MFERFSQHKDVDPTTRTTLTAAGLAVNVSSLALVAYLAFKAPHMAGALLSAWCCCPLATASLLSGAAAAAGAADGAR